MRPLRLRHNVLWAGVGTFASAATQWLALAALTKLASSLVVGQYALGLATTAPIYALTGLQLKAYLGTDTKDECTFGEYLGTRIVLTIVGFCAILVIAYASVDTASTRYAVLAVGAAKAIECFSDLTYGAFQKHRRMDLLACSLMLRGVLSSAALIGITWATGSLVLGIISLGVSWALVLFLYDLPRAASFGSVVPQFHMNTLKIVGKTYPMAIALAIGTLTLAMPRYLLQHHYGESAVGIYSALFYVVTANMLCGLVFASAVSPKLADSAANSTGQYLRLISLTTGVTAGCSLLLFIVVAVMGDAVLSIAYTSEYATHNVTFLLLSGAGIVAAVSCVLDYGLIALRYIKMRLLVNAVALAIGLFAGLILVPRLQYVGAAASYLTAVASMLSCQVLIHLYVWRGKM